MLGLKKTEQLKCFEIQAKEESSSRSIVPEVMIDNE